MKGALLTAMLLLTCAATHAQAGIPATADDPDSEVARKHFARGTELYGDLKYNEAIVEFVAANEAKPHPDFDYNIGRCYDRLGDWPHAIDYYKRYLAAAAAATPTGAVVDTDANDVRARIADLEARVRRATPVPVVPPPAPPPWRLRVAAIALGAAAVATVAVGGGMYGWAAADVPSRRAYCRSLPRQCVPSEWQDLSQRANASYALFGVAGALVVADAIVWTLDLKQRRDRNRQRVSVAPTGRGVVIGGAF